MHLMASIEVSDIMKYRTDIIMHSHGHQRGIYDIEHQITYHGCNFIFHDSQGFESGASEELEHVWKFIEKQSSQTELRDQLHAIWYIYIDSLHTKIANLLLIGTVFPWTILDLFYLQNLSSLLKGQGKVGAMTIYISNYHP
jgi:hypothetical protein